MLESRAPQGVGALSSMADFQVIEHTADVGILAFGKDLPETFANAARGLYSIMLEGPDIEEEVLRAVEVTGPDREGLLVEWLNELVYIFEVEGLVFNRFAFVELNDNALKAICHGQKLVSWLHRVKIGVKAATYHMLEIEEKNGFRARVLFDI